MQSGEKANPKLPHSTTRARHRTVHMSAEDVKGMRPGVADDKSLGVGLPESEPPLDIDTSSTDLFAGLDEGYLGLESDEPSTHVQADPFGEGDALESDVPVLEALSDTGELGFAAGLEDDAASFSQDNEIGVAAGDTKIFESESVSAQSAAVLESTGDYRQEVPRDVEGLLSDAEGEEENHPHPSSDAASGHATGLRVKDPSDGVLVGFLVSFEGDTKGAFVELRSGRAVITSEPCSSGTAIVIDHPSVSPMHAILRIQEGGEVHVLDQLSEYGTRIFRAESANQEILSGDKSTLRHGDVVVFGSYAFHVCLVSSDLGLGKGAE